jgi:hypothetical protein
MRSSAPQGRMMLTTPNLVGAMTLALLGRQGSE